MQVIAIKQGYHGKLRQPDDKFDVPEGSKSRSSRKPKARSRRLQSPRNPATPRIWFNRFLM